LTWFAAAAAAAAAAPVAAAIPSPAAFCRAFTQHVLPNALWTSLFKAWVWRCFKL